MSTDFSEPEKIRHWHFFIPVPNPDGTNDGQSRIPAGTGRGERTESAKNCEPYVCIKPRCKGGLGLTRNLF